MKRFLNYIYETLGLKSRKYVAVIYDDETQKNLREFYQNNGVDLTVSYNGNPQAAEEFEFHTTIFYSTTLHDKSWVGSYELAGGSAIPIGYELFGLDKNVPVLKVDRSGVISYLRTVMSRIHDMEDAWPEYKPHISISYNKDQIPDIANLPIPTFPLTFNKYVIENIES